jgi:hypothetical protein
MEHQGKDRPEMVSASELKDFLFCHLAWFLNQRGFRNTPRAISLRNLVVPQADRVNVAHHGLESIQMAALSR